MKLGLLGFPIAHSLSPKIYKDLLGNKLTTYELFEIPNAVDIPSLEWFRKHLNGLNITAPYKSHFMDQIKIESVLAKKVNAVNVLAFTPQGTLGTNTDAIAVEKILKRFQKDSSDLNLIILGDGAMAKLTGLIAIDLNIPFNILSRKTHSNLSALDLMPFRISSRQNIVINACSRSFVFSGQLSKDDIFWDFNYSFLPHQNTLPLQVKTYCDGQELLVLQAQAAVEFWKQSNS